MPKENGMRNLSDNRLRHESTRRRLLFIAISVAFTGLTLVAIGSVRQAGLSWAGVAAIAALILLNLGVVFITFRWMSAPAKERARRRRESVLKMLGVEDQETGAAPAAEATPEP